MLVRDVQLDESDTPQSFLIGKHCQYLKHYVTNKEQSYEQMMVEYLKISGIYWTTTALQLVNNDFDAGNIHSFLFDSW